MTLDLRHIESFVAVADTRSFSIAADRAGTVQSAVSAHIRLLEERVKLKLVERGRGKPVDLTPDGRSFLEQARRLLALADEVESSGPRQTESPPVRIGTTTTFALSVVPRALSALAFDAPSIATSVSTARSHEMREFLEQGAVDIALVLDRGPHPGRIETAQVPLVWSAHESFAEREIRPLPLAFLDDARDLRRHALAAIGTGGRIDAVVKTHPDPVGLRAALLAGLTATVLPHPALVAPLVDIGDTMHLPALARVTVSIYTASVRPREEVQSVVNHLIAKMNDPGGSVN